MAGRKLLEIVEGWTQELEAFRLWSDGAPVNLTGLTLDLIVTDKSGAAVTIDRSSQLRVDSDQSWDATTQVGGRGKFYLTPTAGQFLNSATPHTVRAKLTDGSGKIAFWPNGAPDTLIVYKP